MVDFLVDLTPAELHSLMDEVYGPIDEVLLYIPDVSEISPHISIQIEGLLEVPIELYSLEELVDELSEVLFICCIG